MSQGKMSELQRELHHGTKGNRPCFFKKSGFSPLISAFFLVDNRVFPRDNRVSPRPGTVIKHCVLLKLFTIYIRSLEAFRFAGVSRDRVSFCALGVCPTGAMHWGVLFLGELTKVDTSFIFHNSPLLGP